MLETTIIFALSASRKLAHEIADILHIKLGNCEVHTFADGEIMARPIDSVRGKRVYVIQSTNEPGASNLLELLIFVDALKRADAESVNCVIPYFGYSRQDRIARPGEPISAKLVADLLTVAGANRVMTIDLHTPQIQGFFSIPVDILSPIPLFGEKLMAHFELDGIFGKDIVVVSPDHGSANRARDLATNIPGSTIAIIDKRRPEPNQAEVLHLIGEVKNKVAIIIDDMIDTGGTMIAGTDALLKAGAISVYGACTHGIFSRGALEKLLDSPIKRVIMTNTIEKDYSAFPINRIRVISVAPIFAEVIEHIEKGIPIDQSLLSYY